mmetsp:Transcript_3729/g.7416  ORF Transcript_3729/g.7416 Transcript_3729/m.7416 type:complete len:81 (+) Transcript_3729:1-243(+)
MGLNHYHCSRKVSESYEKGIAAAAKEEFIQAVAQGCELFADYKVRSSKVAEARDYYIRAAEMYEKWGARTKSEILLEKIP